jgi:hypothetical protein
MNCEVSRHFRNKRIEYLKDKINELATDSENKNITNLYTEVNEFKIGYHPRRSQKKETTKMTKI